MWIYIHLDGRIGMDTEWSGRESVFCMGWFGPSDTRPRFGCIHMFLDIEMDLLVLKTELRKRFSRMVSSELKHHDGVELCK